MSKKLTEGSVVLISDKVGDKVSYKEWDIGTILWEHPDGDFSVAVASSGFIWKGKKHLCSLYVEASDNNTIDNNESEDDGV